MNNDNTLIEYKPNEITIFKVKICPDSVDQLITGETLYTFWQNNRHKDVTKRQCALIRVSKDQLTFILNYDSYQDKVQVSEPLPISDLQQIVIHLRQAGFR